ncbi:hypothetical protein CTAM01_16041 [Colletotrichum tamarilloi]|uniref:Ankyrin repeat protein n=1 Tax=Colletotrichum tamarilloi TaxID=1209934 RepID=A0ABQ9QJN6_9PEZI|nr:uncharacterized protein CTAM01_16041 [Colletotrichum tamarilloi]KAK1474012.1 hypothetical protein CTAM01_16041 [Colletotrichum tamarilloi]
MSTKGKIPALNDVTAFCTKCTNGALDFSNTLFAKDRPHCYGNALQMACAEGFYCIVQKLVLDGADVNDQGGWYGNALQAACAEGRESIAQMLLDNGARVNAVGGHYNTALQAVPHLVRPKHSGSGD